MQNALAALVFLGLAGAGLTGQSPRLGSPTPLTLQAPIDTWDEALPLGNGLIGALVWGADHTIRISLDRGDLWDQRLPEIYSRPGWNYATMQRLKAEGNQAEMNRLFDIPYDTIAYPTKLPAGRVELTLPDTFTGRTFDLDLRRAEASVRGNTGAAKVFVHATTPVVLVWTPGALAGLSVAAPAAVAKLGYAKAASIESDGFTGYIQDAALGLRYGVLARSQRSRTGTLTAITVFVSKDGADPLPAARTLLTASLARGYDGLFAAHARWWATFWRTSSVTIPDAPLQRHYDLVKYFYGAASRAGSPPMPLQGVWTADSANLPPWKGDYHNDLNTQTTYIAYQTAGLFEAGRSYLGFMSRLLPQFRTFAKEFYGVDGAVVPGVMTLDGKAMGGWGQYSLSPTNGAWVAHLFARHWRYTRDVRFLEEEAYPFCRDIATALAALLQEGADGRLRLPLSTSPEIFDNSMRAWLPPMSNYDAALVRGAFLDVAELDRVRGHAADAARWTALAARLPADHIDSRTHSLMFAEGLPYFESHRHFSHAMAVHPLGQYALSQGPDAAAVINGTLDAIKQHGTQQWVGYSFSWFASMLARAGRADEALGFLKTFERSFTLRNGFHANGEQTREGLSAFRYRPFTLEGNFLAMEAVHEMLLQSHDGVLHLFPAVSAAWPDVRFERLRAEGGFVVSAERKAGKTIAYSVTATVDGTLRMRNPVKDGTLTVEMKKGQAIRVRAR